MLLSLLMLGIFSFSVAGPLGMCIDYGDFYFDGNKSSLEIYFRVDRSMFSFNFDSTLDEYVGQMGLKIEIKEKSGRTVDSLSYTTQLKIGKNKPLSQKYHLFDVYPFEIRPGEYSVFISASDLYSGAVDSITLPIHVRDFHKTPAASAIMLAVSSDSSSAPSPLVHAGRKMLPAPDGIFDLNTPKLFYYIEFYLPDDDTKTYIVRTTVSSTNGVSRKFESQRLKLGYASAYINGFLISSLPDGKYELTVDLLDTLNNIAVSARKPFEIRKFSPELLSLQDTADIGMINGILSYLLPREQIKVFNSLDNNGKKIFWERFWAKNDTSPATPDNEIKNEYIKRWKYANTMFSESDGTPGWQTDKGRIYIVYGPPDNIERHGLEPGCDPYERWDYFSLSGGTFFIFSDRVGKSKLVHSNADGEVNDPYWKDRITAPASPSYFEKLQPR